MQLTDLPPEVFIIIIRKLDLCSVLNLYNTCSSIRSIVCMHGVLKQCCMSRNIIATVNTLKLKFFKDISYSLLELNMCGVPDLNKTTVIAAMKKLKQLKVLDISFTNLDILDLIEIHNVCPTLKDITINLHCGRFGNVPIDVRLKCQSVFEHFTNIHFLGSLINLLCSKIILFILAKSKLHHLKYTCTESSSSLIINDSITDDDYVQTPQAIALDFDQFTAFIMNWRHRNTPTILRMKLTDFPVLSLIKLEKYEYVVIAMEEFTPQVYASPIFNNFFKEIFNITIECSKHDMNLSPNMIVLLWSKAVTNFNDIFHHRLAKLLRQYLPYYFQLDSENNKLAAFEYDWFYTIPSEPVREKPDYIIKRIGNKRVAAPNFLLNYDNVFKEKSNIELTLLFKNPINSAIGLTADCDYLRKLTYLSLINLGRYSLDFFNILFRCCVNLQTLNVEGSTLPPCSSTIARSLPFSQSLKNLRLVDRDIDFSSLFTSFTLCSTLENFHVVDGSGIWNGMGNPSLVVERCNQLCGVYIGGEMSAGTRINALKLFYRAKKLYNKSYLHVVIRANSEALAADCSYNTYIDLFRLNAIRPVLR